MTEPNPVVAPATLSRTNPAYAGTVPGATAPAAAEAPAGVTPTSQQPAPAAPAAPAGVTPTSQQPTPATPAAPAGVTPTSQQPAVTFNSLFGTPAQEPAAPAPKQDATPDATAALLAEIAELKKLVSSSAAPAATPAADVLSGFAPKVSDKDREVYGDSINLMDNIAKDYASLVLESARKEYAALAEQLKQELGGEVHELKQGVGEFRRGTYEQQLRVAAPDLDTIVSTPGFDEFLSKQVPYSGGRTVRDTLAQANQAGDLPRVLEILQDFRNNASSVTAGVADGQAKFVQPATTSTPVTTGQLPSNENIEDVLSPANRHALHQRVIRGGGPEAKAALDEFDKMYNEAVAQGLIKQQY